MGSRDIVKGEQQRVAEAGLCVGMVFNGSSNIHIINL